MKNAIFKKSLIKFDPKESVPQSVPQVVIRLIFEEIQDMKISFFLTRPTASNETSIYARICYEGYKFKFYVPERIKPKYWNKDTQKAKETQKFREYPEFNSRLENFKSDIRNVYRKYVNDNGVIPSPGTLRPLLNTAIKNVEETSSGNNFFEFFNRVIETSKNGTRLHHKTGKPIAKETLKTYVTTLRHLRTFNSISKRKIDFATIDLDFYCSYTEYLIQKLKLSTNTVGKHIQVIKLMLNEATDLGYNTNVAFKSKRFATLRENSDSIYLTESEIHELENLDLSQHSRLEKVRDLFLIGCYTGLRYSDYSMLKADQINGGYIELTQTKTGDGVIIPIHPVVRNILNKYANNLPKSISNQKTNQYLKEIGKKVPSLAKTIAKTSTKGGLRLSKDYFKWEQLSTHTARRSFATNEYLAGTPTITIMATTGHRTEKAFMRYIKLTSSEHAKLLKLHWDKRAKLKVV